MMVFPLAAAAALLTIAQAPNELKLDPRQGTLATQPLNHWAALGGKITLQPFARYRVVCQARAKTASGTVYAPYVYAWDSYEWAFNAARPVPNTGESVRLSTEFVAPGRDVYVHPLAYMDAAGCDATLEDAEIVKVAGPAEAMRDLLAKPEKTDDDLRILVRWHVANGRMKEAAEVLPKTTGPTRADVATVLALATKDSAQRRTFTAEAVAWGGPTYFEGVARFEQMAGKAGDGWRMSVCADALRMNPSLERAGRGVALIVKAMVETPAGTRTAREQAARTRMVAQEAHRFMAVIPSDSAAAKAVSELPEITGIAAAAAQASVDALGKAQVVIGGTTVRAATHAIVLPARPTPQETHAARELRRHLELITGEALPIRAEGAAGKTIPLYVGKCEARSHPALRLPTSDLGLEGLRISTSGPAIAFTGNKRGVGYAVSTFLQDDLGCRWFTPDCATWPTSGRIVVGKLSRRHVPPLEYRAGDYPVARPGDFASRLRLNGANHGMTEEQGSKVGVHSLAHTFAALCPPEKYFAAHPEYFSLVGRKRQSGYAQLCLTNPEVLKIVIAGVRQWIRDLPQMTVFSVSQNDTANYCECEKCAAIEKEEGGQAGPMLRFVNAVADDIRKDHPAIAIETLAYQYTRKPPKITRPRPNVIVCLCSIECCFIHPLETDPFNKAFVDDIKGWSRICKRLWIWDYIINYAHSICPFPNLRVLAPNIQFFLRSGVTGIYEESCYFTKGSELQELRNYLMAQALWNPKTDMERATSEFCEAYYGPAAPAILAYLALIHTATQQDQDRHVTIYSHPRDIVTVDMLSRARDIFDQAESAVRDDPARLHRVQVARLPILYAEITLARGGAWAEREGALVQQRATDVTALAARFESIARKEGVTAIREGGGDAGLDAWLQSIPRTAPKVPIEKLSKGKLELSVLPALGGRIWRMRTLPDGGDLIPLGGSPDAWRPLEHGYEEYSQSTYRSQGWQNPHTVLERSPGAVTMEAKLANGLSFRRKIVVDTDRPIVTVTSTLTNTSGAPKTACLRIHPAFAVSSTARATVRIAQADGTTRTMALANPADPNAERDSWLQATDKPAGMWSIVDGDTGIEIVNRFRADTVDKCLLNWSGGQKRVNLEVFSPERVLAPGESLGLEMVYEVVGLR